MPVCVQDRTESQIMTDASQQSIRLVDITRRGESTVDPEAGRGERSAGRARPLISLRTAYNTTRMFCRFGVA